ncbi:class II fructose-bisphosphate aldolase [Pseudactinotalea sp. HY158]|uniref:class II fructose-bisphosphate aldolase n=1 Tax=Pseudactinotalea sp. HY158 TaxID=2654547 RepID=UPI00129C2BC4|nr:class II fructose-bisphosphate aldolase [Pseudactinotalea sp. HY158]QGH70284.1 ketose-bisphosphate aldolase [Pseudactinotalea sp. HY158]
MPLVTTAELFTRARNRGQGLPAFNVLHLETIEAIAAGAERTGTGVVLQISQNCVRYHGGLAPLAAASRAVAESSSAPLSLHLDHAEDLDLVREALDLGFSSVMYDGATLDYPENVARTVTAVSAAHAVGAIVEAELGEIGGKDGAHAPGVRTDPAEAARFAADTGVDALAVAVGSSHAMLERTAELDTDLIAAIAAAVPVPLVLHGSSGVPDASIQAGIRSGMVKVNISTQLNKMFTAGVRERLGAQPDLVDSRKYLGAGRDRLADEVARLVDVLTMVTTA